MSEAVAIIPGETPVNTEALSLMRRLTIVCALIVLSTALFGCGQSALEQQVNRCLAFKESPSDSEAVVSAGDKAIPLVFNGLRASHSDRRRYLAEGLVMEMRVRKTVDPSAPAIRRVLADKKEISAVRVAAANMLVSFWDCPAVESDLRSVGGSDSVLTVRARCIAALGGVTENRILRTGCWQVSGSTQHLLSMAIKDRSPLIRREACRVVVDIASGARHTHVHLDWCGALIRECEHDPDKETALLARQWLRRGVAGSK